MEAQRVINCLEDALDRLSLLSYVPAGNPSQELLHAFVAEGVGNIKTTLESEWQLEEGHQVMVRSRESGPFGKGIGAVASSNEMLDQLHHIVRTLCRQLKKSPAAVQILYAGGPDGRSAPFLAFLEFLSDLTHVMFRKLSTTVEEEATSKNLLHDLSERERSAEDERDALHQTLQLNRAERDRELSTMDQLITKLRAELHDITQSNQMEMESIRQEMKENMEQAEAEHLAKGKRLQDRIDQLSQEMVRLRDEHREKEAALRKKKEKHEHDLAAQIKTYDTDMAAKQTETLELMELMKEEKGELDQLEDYFDKIDKNQAQKNEEERILTEFKRRLDAARGVLDRAATKLQARARGGLARTELAGSKKKGKKGGKKGKKKK